MRGKTPTHRPTGWSSLRLRPFLSSGKRCSRQSRMASSSRWVARSAGCCQLRPKRRRIRPTWEGWYDTPNSFWMTWATRRRVQISPQNPKAVRPRLSNSGSWAPLPVVQLGRSAGWLAAPGLATPCPGLAHLLADHAFADAQGLSDVLLFPALLDQFPSPHPAGFFPHSGRFNIRAAHRPIVSPSHPNV